MLGKGLKRKEKLLLLTPTHDDEDDNDERLVRVEVVYLPSATEQPLHLTLIPPLLMIIKQVFTMMKSPNYDDDQKSFDDNNYHQIFHFIIRAMNPFCPKYTHCNKNHL